MTRISHRKTFPGVVACLAGLCCSPLICDKQSLTSAARGVFSSLNAV